MLYATNRFPGDGRTTTYEISFVGGYLDRTHVRAYIEDASLVQTPVTLTSGNFLGPSTLAGITPIPVGSTLVVYRDTPKAPLVDFVNGSRMTEANLDTATRQGAFIAAEGADASLGNVAESASRAEAAAQTATSASTTAVSAKEQAVSASVAAVASAEAAAAAAHGSLKAYATRAEAEIAAALLPDGTDIEVAQDETRAGARTRYKVQAGSLVFVVNLDQTKLDLAAATGASIVGYNAQFLNAVTRTLQSKAQEFPSVFDYMTGNEITAVLSEVSGADLTTPFQRALTAMTGLSAGRQRYLEVPRGLYPLTQIKMEDLQDVTVIMKGAKLNAISAAALTSMVEIVNTLNFRILGSWEALGGNRTNYEAMVHCTARPGGVIEPTNGICTTTEIHGLVGRNAKCVLQLGDYTKDDVISEINVYGLGAKDCPTVVHGGGSQTGATFHGCNITSEANAVINAVPGTAPEIALWLEGGFYTVNGGEVLHLLSSANETIRMSPCQSAFYSSPYPMLRMNGVHFECAAVIAAISNPRGIAAPSSDISQLALIGCGGYMNPSIAASNLIDIADASYAGRVQVRGGNFYSQITPRAAQNIGVIAGAPTLIDTDSTSFGAGHKHWLGGISGGKVLHDPIAAISASNLNSQSVASGASGILKWITKASSGVFGRYAAAYDTATGVFTVPAFGVTSMRISMAAAVSSPGAGYVEVLRNGSRAAIRKIVATDLSVDIEYSENDIPAGTTYSIQLSSTGGTPIAFAGSATDFLTVTIGTN